MSEQTGEQTGEHSTWTVTGMTCGHCVASVAEEVGALPDVQDVQVDLESGRVDVTATRPLERAEVAAAVEEAGYALA